MFNIKVEKWKWKWHSLSLVHIFTSQTNNSVEKWKFKWQNEKFKEGPWSDNWVSLSSRTQCSELGLWREENLVSGVYLKKLRYFWTFDSFLYRYMPVVSKWVSSWRTQETWRKSESVKKKNPKYKFWLKHYCGISLKSFSVFLLQLFIHLNSAKFQPHSAQDYFPYKKVFARN